MMRMTTEDFTKLAAAVAPLDTSERRWSYAAGTFPHVRPVTDLSRRYRWDLFWEAEGIEAIGVRYADAHIDTALRRIVPMLAVNGMTGASTKAAILVDAGLVEDLVEAVAHLVDMGEIAPGEAEETLASAVDPVVAPFLAVPPVVCRRCGDSGVVAGWCRGCRAHA